MFRAKNKTTGEDIIILDLKWKMRVRFLRSLDRDNVLACPGCDQPVRVRAGRKRRWHFAHKHLQNCSYGFVAPVVLDARAVLYNWLKDQFEERVSIEKEIADVGLPRPIDCWVETEKGDFAYWIIGSRLKPHKREDIQSGFRRIDAQVHWVFVQNMLREDEVNSDALHLTTTEREFACQTDFDEIRVANNYEKGKSLHYLDPVSQKMVTYRGLRTIHPPQLYQGRRIENDLASLTASPENGEFVHPGELKRLEDVRQAKIQVEHEKRERGRKIDDFYHRYRRKKNQPQSSAVSTIENDLHFPAREESAVCVLCGQITKDYWYLNREDNTCKCRKCYQQGRY